MSTCENEILKRMGVDPERYEGTLTKTWGKAAGGNVQYSIELTPRLPTDFATQLKATAKTLTRGLKPIKRADPLGASDYGLLALSDLHLGQDGLGGIERQTRDAMELGVTLVDEMLSKWEVGRVGVLLNGDIMHVDSIKRTTTGGTPIEDACSDYPTMFTTTLAGVSGLVNWVAKRRPVDLFVVTGNHDFHAAFHLGVALECAYADVDRVRIIGGMEKFLMHRWGANMLVFHHGDTQSELKNLKDLASEQWAVDWGETLYRYFYTGHVHTPLRLKNHTGLAALVPRGNYAKNKGYPPELRGGIGHVFDLVKGRVGEVARHFA